MLPEKEKLSIAVPTDVDSVKIFEQFGHRDIQVKRTREKVGRQA